jgi:hypothetical protein
MAAGYRNKNSKRLLSKTALHHLQAVEYGIGRRKICSDHKEWNFHDFVERAVEVIIILRTRDKE